MSLVAETEVRPLDPQAAFDHLATHIAEHGIDPEPLPGGGLGFEYDGARIELRVARDSLRLRVSAGSENLLYFLKEGAASHLAEVAPMEAEALAWSDGVVTARPVNLHVLTLHRREEPYSGMVRLHLGGADVSRLAADGLHVKMLVPRRADRPPIWPRVASNGVTLWPEGEDALHVRYFTVRAVDPASGRVVVDVVRHPGGAVSDWAAGAELGSQVGLMGPGGGSVPRGRSPLLLAGDETALPAIARIMEECGSEARGVAVVALPDGVRANAYLPESALRILPLPSWRFDRDIVATLSVLADERFGYAWFGGEHSTAQAVRAVFKGTYGLGKGQQLSVSYWRRGVAGDARREED